MAQIHSPFGQESKARWWIRGLISFLLTAFGGVAGSEGAAIEWTQAILMKLNAQSIQWFEQKRRTRVSMSLASGVSAAFSAPFAGAIFPIELGMGGRTLDVIVTSFSAWIALQWMGSLGFQDAFLVQGRTELFHWGNGREAFSLLAIGGMGGIASLGVMQLIRYTQEGLLNLFQTRAWMRILAGAILLALVFVIYPTGQQPARILLENIYWSKFSLAELGLFFGASLLSVSLLVAGFGSCGVLWPLLLLGVELGFGVQRFLFQTGGELAGLAGLAGASALWGGVLGTPLTAAILSYELSRDFTVIIPCFGTALLARWICRRILKQNLFDLGLKEKGISLLAGKSASVLDSILVKDAMVQDFETVSEIDSLSTVHSQFFKSRYPFLPVLNSQGFPRGVLSIDMLHQIPASEVLEAKDLMYRNRMTYSSLKANERLSASTVLFETSPCILVLGEDLRVVGLLFSSEVRLAYERELTRRSLHQIRSEQT
jgi:CIC family chloride channel protein